MENGCCALVGNKAEQGGLEDDPKYRFARWEALNVEHTAGGVLLLWDKRVLELTDSKVDTFSVSCCWKSIIDGFEWVGTGVYGPTRDDMRSGLWDELRDVCL